MEQVRGARAEQIAATQRAELQLKDIETRVEKVSRARSVAASAMALAAESLKEVTAQSENLKEMWDAQEIAIAKETKIAAEAEKDRWTRLDREEVEGRAGVQAMRAAAVAKAREGMIQCRKDIEDLTGELQVEDPVSRDAKLRRTRELEELSKAVKIAEEDVLNAREEEAELTKERETMRLTLSAETEARYQERWKRAQSRITETEQALAKVHEERDAAHFAVDENRVRTMGEFARRVPEVRAVIVKRVKEAARKFFEGRLDQQLQATSQAKAELDLAQLKLAAARRAKRSANDKLNREKRMKDDDWEKERQVERTRLAQLQDDRDHAVLEYESRRNELGVDTGKRRRELEEENRALDTQLSNIETDARTERETIRAKNEEERKETQATFQKRLENLESVRKIMEEKLAQTGARNRAVGQMEPIGELNHMTDVLISELASLHMAIDLERRQVADYDALIQGELRKKQVQAEGASSRLHRDAQERVLREQASFNEEKSVLQAELDQIVDHCTDRRKVVAQLRATRSKDKEHLLTVVEERAAKCALAVAELRPELKRHQSVRMSEADVGEVDELLNAGRRLPQARIEERIKHEKARCQETSTLLRLIPVERQLEVRAAEFELSKVVAELDALEEEDRSLLERINSAQFRHKRMVAAKETAMQAITDIIVQNAADEQRRIMSLATVFKADFRALPNERKGLLASTVYQVSKLRTHVEQIDRNIALLSTSLDFKIDREARAHMTELRKVAQSVKAAKSDLTRMLVDGDRMGLERLEDHDRRTLDTVATLRRRQAAVQGQLKSLPGIEMQSERFTTFMRRQADQKTKAFEQYRAIVQANELAREQTRARLEGAAQVDALAAGVSVEQAKVMVDATRFKYEEREKEFSQLEAVARQALLEAAREPEMDALKEEFNRTMADCDRKVEEITAKAQTDEQAVRDRMAANRRLQMEEAAAVRTDLAPQWMEYEELGSKVLLAKSKVAAALKQRDISRRAEDVALIRQGQEMVHAYRSVELEKAEMPNSVKREQYKIDETLRIEMDLATKTELELEAKIAQERVGARQAGNHTESKLKEMRSRSDEIQIRYVEANDLVVERKKVAAQTRVEESSATRAFTQWGELRNTMRATYEEQGVRSDVIEDRAEEQIEEYHAKLLAKIKVIDDQLQRIVREREVELEQAIGESTAELNAMVTKVFKVHDQSVADMDAREQESLEELAMAEVEAKNMLETSKLQAIQAIEQRMEAREVARQDAARERAKSRDTHADEHRRQCVKYEKEMTFMGKTIEKVLVEVLQSYAKEEVKLEEERIAEVRRLEVNAQAELEDRLAEEAKAIAAKHENERLSAEQEVERMRRNVMEELKKMEEDSRKRIEEEMLKMQQLQLLMQQEALSRMEETMKTEMEKIQEVTALRNATIDAKIGQDRVLLQKEIDEARKAKMQLLERAWKKAGHAASRGASAVGSETGLEGADLAAYEEEKGQMERELRALEAQLAEIDGNAGDTTIPEEDTGEGQDEDGVEDDEDEAAAEAELARLEAELRAVEEEGRRLEAGLQGQS